MRMVLIAVLGGISALSNVAHASPSFNWIGPWTVSFPPQQCGLHNSVCNFGVNAFGASATQDHQVTDVTADTAVGKSSYVASDFASSGTGGLTFSRSFILNDSPAGWNLTLQGNLDGTLLAGGTADGNLRSSVRVDANARIISTPLNLQWSEARSTPPVAPNPFIPIHQAKDISGLLSDGLYTVAGSLQTQGVGEGTVGGSNFFPGLVVSLNASPIPVPEPATFLLVLSGLASISFFRGSIKLAQS